MSGIVAILPENYGYEKVIESELRRLFDYVYIIFENIEYRHKLLGIAHKRLPNSYAVIAERYYRRMMKDIRAGIDVVLIIRGASLDNRSFQFLKSTFSEAKFILYEWDSIENLPNAELLASGCDLVQTFDPIDAEQKGWGYLPLFFHAKTEQGKSRDIDLCFVGGLHSERAQVLEQLSNFSTSNGLEMYSYLYSYGTRVGLALRKYVTQREANCFLRNSKFVRFAPLSLDQMNDVYSRSRVVVDYAHPGQNGLTMRTIECLGHSCKLITNNKCVRNADFYNEANIKVYEGVELDLDMDFVLSPYIALSDEVIQKYHISNWVKEVLKY